MSYITKQEKEYIRSHYGNEINNYPVEITPGRYLQANICETCYNFSLTTRKEVNLTNTVYIREIDDIYCKYCKKHKYGGNPYRICWGGEFIKVTPYNK